MIDVQPLTRSHDRQGFDCGSERLNVFLRTTARQHQERGISRTFVLIDPGSDTPARILGFFTLSACESISADLPLPLATRFPRILPAVLLGRLAVDREFQGRGFGGVLLIEAICRVAALSTQLGIAGLFVDAKDDRSAAFYQRFGFLPLPSNPRRLFLPLETLLRIAQLSGR